MRPVVWSRSRERDRQWFRENGLERADPNCLILASIPVSASVLATISTTMKLDLGLSLVWSTMVVVGLVTLGQIDSAWWKRIQLGTKSSINPISSTNRNESTSTIEATALFFTKKCNLNAWAKSTQLRLTRTDSKSGVGLSWITGVWIVGWVLWVMLFGSCCLGLETESFDLDFECSCCLGLETKRVVLELRFNNERVRDDNLFFLFFSFLCLPNQRWELQSLSWEI